MDGSTAVPREASLEKGKALSPTPNHEEEMV